VRKQLAGSSRGSWQPLADDCARMLSVNLRLHP
jgi:hypothetical protein